MSESWNPGEREMTPESAVLSRRRWLKHAGLIGLPALAAGAGFWWWYRGSDQEVVNRGAYPGPGTDLYPARRNADFKEVDREISPETPVARYCNFYEFSKTKQVWRYVEPFQPVPWQLEVTGLVAKPKTYDQDDLVRAFPLEERVYRHRCVEAWAMVVPWTGFALAKLIRAAGPLPEARFVRFVSFDRPQEANRQAGRLEPWPYTEGLTLAEATHELAFIATGMYGHPLLKQYGAPVRLVVPWKYGYKSAKSLVRIELTEEKPATFWNTLVPWEYDFQANVNPEVRHPRWSQAREWMLGTGEVYETQIYNSYGEWVAGLYRS
ncbi:MAG TPA: protein-methionine-sulfoxide reductase catalytic subunit MsrP [Gemmataceae bacterium]|jgi:sulfoxide reductase catalytic subunit YedY|nr:protein-methionine-sulfoxide reductase catalytic subunit MsrP [Gemmataceae bacterium]